MLARDTFALSAQTRPNVEIALTSWGTHGNCIIVTIGSCHRRIGHLGDRGNNFSSIGKKKFGGR